MFDFNEKDYILGFWFAEIPNGDNVLLSFWKHHLDGEWKGKLRYRKSVDEKIFDSYDKKTWYYIRQKPEVSEEEIISIAENIFNDMGIIFLFSDRLIVKGNVDKLLKLASTKSWMHIKMETIN